MNQELLRESLLQLIKMTATQIPADILAALQSALQKETPQSAGYNVFQQLLENVELAEKEARPICQDTGTNVFYIEYPVAVPEKMIKDAAMWAVQEATKKTYLRPNCVDSLSGKNTGNNIGPGHPQLHFSQWDKDYIHVDLMLKGGGSENVGKQFKLPDSRLKAGRDLKGVEKCVIDAVFEAQGMGCAPGLIGVGIGGDRGTSYLLSKKQLFRKLTDRNEISELAELEERLLVKLNRLEIGPMGFGGKTTVLGVKMAHMYRLPACYFVSVTYMCWAARRHSLNIYQDRFELLD